MSEATTANVTIAKERQFPCKGCGADLVFAPKEGSLVCPSCGHVEKIPQTAAEIKEYSFNDYLHKPRATGYGKEGADKGSDVHCGGCGAVTHFDSSLTATTCPFCGAPLVADGKGKNSDDVIRPEALIPFAITLQQAQETFKKWISSLWFAPSNLSGGTQLKQILGIYRPFWTYDTSTVSHWVGERGDYYYTTESYTANENGKSVQKTRQVRHTRWTTVMGVYSDFFDDVLISAGKNTDHTTEFKLNSLNPYAPEYLSGFVAERYVISCEDGWAKAKETINGLIYASVRKSIGGNEQRVTAVTTAYNAVTYKHILLPLWLSSYRYGEKTFQFQVNGQTGEAKGSRPYSFWKIFFLVAGIIAAIILIVALAHGSK